MKIISLNAENFKRIVAIEITPTGNIVEIAGKNGQGKSSILDAIWVALAGLGVAPKQPIRKGELEARIVLTLGGDKPEIVVTRTFRPGKDGGDVTSSLKVESADGAKYSSPQQMLDKLLGSLAFDPLAFERMDARAQFDALRQFVPGVDFEALDIANRGDYDRRTHQNRIGKEARAAATAMRIVTPSGQRVDETALVAELEGAGKHNTDIETRKANRAKIQDKVALLRRTAEGELRAIKEHEDAIVACRERLQSMEEESAREQGRLDAAPPLPQPIDTSVLLGKIANARRTNAEIDDAQRAIVQRDELVAKAKAAEAAAATLSESIDMREIKKREAIAAAKLPVDGITFGDNEILLGGVPFSQASDAERLCASISMAMAMNPKLRIIRVRDGSLLDEDSMKLLATLAQKRDYQVWIERVDGSGKVGIVIEDGRVKMTSADKPARVEPAVNPQPTGKGDVL